MSSTYDAQLDAVRSDRCRASRAQTITAVLGIGSLMAATVWSEYVNGTSSALLLLDVALGLTSCALVPVLLRLPTGGALVLAVLAAFSPTVTPAATMGTSYVAQSRRFGLAVGVAVAGVVAHAVRGLWRPLGGISFTWWLVLVVIAHAALLAWGALAQARRALIVSLRDRAHRAEAEQGRRVAEARAAERSRIAREMHDVLAHRLSLLATYAGALEFRPDAPPERLANAAGVIRSGVHEALDELREVIDLLRDDDSDDATERPQPTLGDLAGLVEESRSAGMQVRVDNQVEELPAPPAATGRTAYRIVQEALTNARKHAAGQPVRVVLDGAPGGSLCIRVSNPVPDGPPAHTIPGTGSGLVGLTERARLTGGELDHQLTEADGFRLWARLPWPA
ncbi:MAG TPA: histidine kinase [Nocardioidaceae bacterium]|nr:histidine kinase [Nocardioidaceae bacterium]